MLLHKELTDQILNAFSQPEKIKNPRHLCHPRSNYVSPGY